MPSICFSDDDINWLLKTDRLASSFDPLLLTLKEGYSKSHNTIASSFSSIAFLKGN